MFWPLLKYQFFHSKPLLDNCKFHIIKDERRRLVIFYWKCAAYKSIYLLTYLLVSKMEGKTNFSRRLKQFDGLTWLTMTPPPIFNDRSTPLVMQIRGYDADIEWCRTDLGGSALRRGVDTGQLLSEFDQLHVLLTQRRPILCLLECQLPGHAATAMYSAPEVTIFSWPDVRSIYTNDPLPITVRLNSLLCKLCFYLRTNRQLKFFLFTIHCF